MSEICGRIMPRTYPPGLFVCDEARSHTGPHVAHIHGGVALWTDEREVEFEVASPSASTLDPAASRPPRGDADA